MNKNFLGFGILFQAEDKGFIKSLDKSGQAALNLNDDLDKLDKTANGKDKSGKGGIFGKLKSGIDTFGISSLANFGDKMKDLMLGSGEDTIQFTHTIDNLRMRLGQVFDDKQGQKLTSSLASTFVNFGIAADQVDAIANGMLSFGRSADQIAGVMPMIGKMVGPLKMNAEAVAHMFGQGMGYLRSSGDEISNLVKETALFEKKWEIPGLVEQLPELFASAAGNAAQFGKVSSKSVMSTVRSMTGLTAAYVKMGKSQREATTMATNFSGKLTSMKRSITDMMAGLDPMDESMNQLIGVMGMMGKTGSESFDMIMQGASDPDAFRKQLSGMYSGLADDQKAIVGAHLRRVFGEDEVNAIIAYGGDLNKAAAAAEQKGKKLGTASDEFEKLSGAMTNTLELQKKLTENAQTFTRSLAELVQKGNYIKALNNQRDAWLSMASAIGDSESKLGNFLSRMILFQKMGVAGLFPEINWAGYMAPIMFFATSLITALGMFTGAMKAAGSVGMWFAKILLKPFKMLDFLFSGSLTRGMVVLKDGFTALTKPVSAFFNAIKFGARYWTGLGLMEMGNVFKNVTNWIGKALTFLPKMVSSFTSILSTSKLLGPAFRVFSKLLGPFMAIVDMVKSLIGHWNEFMGGFEGKSLFDKIASFFGLVIRVLADGIDGFLLGIPSLVLKWMTGFNSFGEAMTTIGENIHGMILTVFEWLEKKIGDIPGVGWLKKTLFNTSSGVTEKSIPVAAKEQKASQDEIPTVIPTKTQPGAPKSTSIAASLLPSERSDLSDVNFKSVVDAVLDTKDQLAKLLAMLVDKPTDVTLQGDAKKFLSIVNREQARSAAGSVGMNAAVGR